MARKRAILDKYRQQTAPVVSEAIVEVAAPVPVEPPKEERKAAYREDDNPPEAILVNLTGLDREGLERVAMREFGVALEDDMSDDDVLSRVRSLVTGRNRFGLR